MQSPPCGTYMHAEAVDCALPPDKPHAAHSSLVVRSYRMRDLVTLAHKRPQRSTSCTAARWLDLFVVFWVLEPPEASLLAGAVLSNQAGRRILFAMSALLYMRSCIRCVNCCIGHVQQLCRAEGALCPGWVGRHRRWVRLCPVAGATSQNGEEQEPHGA